MLKLEKKQYELKFATRDENNQLRFSSKTVDADSKVAANRIGKSWECPADKFWFRSDLTRDVSSATITELTSV